VFQVHDDYVTQQAEHFRFLSSVAEEHHPEAIPKRLKRLFLQLFIHTGEKVTKFENVSSQKSDRSIAIDFSDH